VVIVVELLIAYALIAFESLWHEPKAAKIEGAEAPPERRDNIVPLITPKASASADGHVGRFVLDCMPRSIGDKITWADAFARYQRWCSEQSQAITPLGAAAFGHELKDLCKYAGIRTRAKGQDVFCLNVKLVA
jgi:hypothetical protein